MISKGTELTTFVTGLNGSATIDTTLLDVLVDTAKTVLEEERPWMALRKTDTSLSLLTTNTWQTAKSLSGITDFSRFYGDGVIKLFDGSNLIHYYSQVPFDRRLEYKDDNSTFVFDENAGTLYFNGTPPFAGTLHIPYVSTSTAIDLASTSAVWSVFPSRFLPLLGFYAIGIHKGAVDYDDINAQMLPENRATMQALKNAMEKWDDARQLSAIENSDPTELYSTPRSGAIDTNS
ncbi:hypothetical protein IVB45_02225 [Bradyrhizobium sp. 4]|uniref:hypothetical protein n=1 Tax=Bradyrhizobium sp. 4 TaxID=2782678 RepID=UPI0020003EFE|nr:hypothetical protein [Bradyrhizobium sp. 4]UPJ35851.1 hypothetical protein IVB45_02225 [Bradyrhizobium sp. 4]